MIVGIFSCAGWPLVYLGEIPVQVFAHFHMSSFAFLLLGFRSHLYILDLYQIYDLQLLSNFEIFSGWL